MSASLLLLIFSATLLSLAASLISSLRSAWSIWASSIAMEVEVVVQAVPRWHGSGSSEVAMVAAAKFAFCSCHS